MRKRIRTAALLLVVMIVAMQAVSVYAHDVPDMTRKGSVTVSMKDKGEPVPGGSLTACKVADIVENNGNYSFALTEEFAQSGIDISDLTATNLAAELAEYAKNHSLEGIEREVGEDGTVKFAGLELGLYLFVQNNPADGYAPVEPFLVTVPYFDGEQYVYDVNATPKVDLEKELETEPTTEPTEPPDLPQTGQLNWPVPILAVAGMALIVIGWMMRTGKKRENEE